MNRPDVLSLPERLRAIARMEPDRWLLEEGGRRLSWSGVAGVSDSLELAARTAGLGQGACLCVVVRNSLESAAAVLGAVMAGRPVVYLNGLHGEEKRIAEVLELRPAMLIGAAADMSSAMVAALGSYGGVGAVLGAGGDLSLCPGADRLGAGRLGAGPFYAPEPDAALVMRTSGTTGAPKLISLSRTIVGQGLVEGTRGRGGAGGLPERLPRSPTLLFAPLFHASGTFATLMAAYEGRSIVVFEKFRVETLRAALRQHGVRFLSMPPAVLRMVLDSDLGAGELSSVLAVRVGTAPLDPAVQAEFEERFSIPVLTTYGATEFMGAIAHWTLGDHRAFGAAKRGSVGRVSPGVELRTVDGDSGAVLAAGEVGLIELRGPRVGSREWIRTNDLGCVDADGFLWIKGRADDAIIRGGFKVLANEVVKVLCRHPDVLEAAVIAMPDRRLGEVPVAAIEPREGAEALTPENLARFAHDNLLPYQVPASFLIVKKLPRTVSLKISRPDVRKLFEAQQSTG